MLIAALGAFWRCRESRAVRFARSNHAFRTLRQLNHYRQSLRKLEWGAGWKALVGAGLRDIRPVALGGRASQVYAPEKILIYRPR